MAGRALVRFCFCGDVMTGRGIDQILPHPGDPALHESYVRDAREYAALAERAHGPIARPVSFPYVWGDALAAWQQRAPLLRIANLETAVTAAGAPWPEKGIHYRMHPANLPVLTAAGMDCWVLANNHVLDWGPAGLAQTLDVLHGAHLATAGAGGDARAAWAPAVLHAGPVRVLVFAACARSAGVPPEWAARADRPGVALLNDLSAQTADAYVAGIRERREAGDLVVVSLHWGGNWGYEIARAHRDFAHRLIDSGAVDLVHGHSSHHPIGIEVRAGKLILYGCGDFLNDYEGIDGDAAREPFGPGLGFMYFASLHGDGTLAALELVPTEIRRMQVRRADARGAAWLAGMLRREGRALGTDVVAGGEGSLRLVWP